jgi:2-phospho-L-lactate guanylyltransferase
MDAGIMPVKSLASAKSRLADHLGPTDRRALVDALFEDALELCRGADFLDWYVVTADEDVSAAASAAGLIPVADPGFGLNPALTAAVRLVLGRGASSATIVVSDLPRARPIDIADILDTGSTSDVVAVPAADGGTSALYLRPPDVMPVAFGPRSLAAHVEAADRAGLRCSLLPLATMELDLDTIEDADGLLRSDDRGSSRTYRVLKELTPF